jgi:U3 small nucleolar RNA-associated protein 14
MAGLKEKNRKKKSIKGKPSKNEKSTFLSKTSKPAEKGRMKKKGKARDDDQRKRRSGGPRIPNVLRKELDMLDPKRKDSDSDPEGGQDVRDLYELEEEIAQEELGKNRRFDEVENYEYELPEDFKVSSKRSLLLSRTLFFLRLFFLMQH